MNDSLTDKQMCWMAFWIFVAPPLAPIYYFIAKASNRERIRNNGIRIGGTRITYTVHRHVR